jgi:hypothetical protein
MLAHGKGVGRFESGRLEVEEMGDLRAETIVFKVSGLFPQVSSPSLSSPFGF